jgi:DNA protecting protein DprA
MDQVASAYDVGHVPERAQHLGYGREEIAFLGISRLKGVGFQRLSGLGGRADIAEALDARNITEIAKRVSQPPGTGKSGSWEDFWNKILSLGQDAAQPLIERRVRLLFADDADFPRSLAALPDELRPRWIFVAGNHDLLSRPGVAVVGTRHPTDDGQFLARYAVGCARDIKAPVVSGLADGIDGTVHEWCLHVSVPTISVLGTGILNPYPAKHASLSDRIVAQGGVVLTEYLPMQGPAGQQFVWRNRLQAALGRATIPIEWKKKSGTAHTVRFSRRLERPVIGLQIDGVPRDTEAGEADQSFAVPREHAAFMEALQRAMSLGGETDAKGDQLDLFE